jgi:Na+/melibiose symporter-like transporter
MIFYKIFWVIDVITTAVILFFFVIGLGDGSVSSYNIALWAAMIILPIALLIGSYILKTKSRLKQANWLLAIMAVPVFLFFLFYVVLILSNPKWN